MTSNSADQELLYEHDDTMIECPECRKTGPAKDYKFVDQCLECDTLLQITPVPSRLERGDVMDVTRGPFDGYTGVVRGLSAPERVELRIRSRDVKRPVVVRLTDVTKRSVVTLYSSQITRAAVMMGSLAVTGSIPGMSLDKSAQAVEDCHEG